MPGYLSNRLISFLPAAQTDMTVVQADIVEVRADIDDLQLSLGV